MAAREHRKTHDDKQTEKMIPLITGEIVSRQQISELVFGVNMFDLIISVQDNQSSATLWGWDTCLVIIAL